MGWVPSVRVGWSVAQRGARMGFPDPIPDGSEGCNDAPFPCTNHRMVASEPWHEALAGAVLTYFLTNQLKGVPQLAAGHSLYHEYEVTSSLECSNT